MTKNLKLLYISSLIIIINILLRLKLFNLKSLLFFILFIIISYSSILTVDAGNNTTYPNNKYIINAVQLTADTLISKGSYWKYNDSGVDLGTSWRNISYNDSLWLGGYALFGYGGITMEATITTLSYGSSSSNKRPTYYFRKKFDYFNVDNVSGIEINALIDDGAVFYLNGVEVYRHNMPSGTITYNTYASALGTESSYIQFTIPTTLIQEGVNIFAVEVHQENATSSDVGFNMNMIARNSSVIITPPTGNTTINQIHFGSTNTALNGATITWRNQGPADSIKWGYDTLYLSGKYAGAKRNNYSEFLYDYTFPTLLIDTVIHYSLWDSHSLMWIPDKIFRTAKIKDADHFSFVSLGDSRTNVNDWAIIAAAVNPKDFVLFNGDLVGTGGTGSYWDDWFSHGISYFEKNLTYYTAGNHDLYSDATASNYRNIMVMPPNPGNEMYYSFTYGNSLFICLNSEDETDPVQHNWLINTLENNKDKKWRFVFFHKPFFTSPTHIGEMDGNLSTWWKTFDDYGVEVIFNGHTHNYQRSVPINRNVSTTTGVAKYGHGPQSGRCQIVAGSAGAPTVAAATGWFVAKSFNIMHYVNVDVKGDTVAIKTYNYNNVAIDSVMIFRPYDISAGTTSIEKCSSDTNIVFLNANGGIADSVTWRKDSLNGTIIGIGKTISLNMPDTLNTYYACWQSAGVITNYASVKINALPAFSDSTAEYYLIKTKVTNSDGDIRNDSILIKVLKLPSNAGIITGQTMVSNLQSNVVYTVPAIANATNYIWTLPNGATGTSNTNTINVNFSNATASGNITVKGNNSCGMGQASSLFINLDQSNNKKLKVHAMLQAYYLGNGIMSQAMNYDQNLDMFEAKFVNPVAVDTVSLFIRSTIAPNYDILTEFHNLYLYPNGNISEVLLPHIDSIYKYNYVVLKHRNSIETWSDSINFSDTLITYNYHTNPISLYFTDNMYAIYSNNNYNGSLVWAGDVNQDGIVNIFDLAYVFDIINDPNALIGYILEDINGDGMVNIFDLALVFDNVNLSASSINPFTMKK